jgi:ABC-type thiamin/hydroxymethylpyrimidine transport system permease subunit
LRYTTKELALIVIFSSLGAFFSVPIGYLGNYLKSILILPFGTGQILSGFHLIPITFTSLYVNKPGATTMTATVKGLIEAILFSYHGIPVILMSALQGLLLDIVIHIFGKRDLTIYLGCGLSSASNVVFLQFFLFLPFSASVFLFMYILASISGTVFGGYSGILLFKMVRTRMPI